MLATYSGLLIVEINPKDFTVKILSHHLKDLGGPIQSIEQVSRDKIIFSKFFMIVSQRLILKGKIKTRKKENL